MQMKKLTIQSKIGLAIRKLRKDRNISQEKLALESEVDRRYLSDLENGKRNVSIDILERLANHFEMDLSDVLKIAETIETRFKTLDELKGSLVDRGFDESIVLESPDYLDAVVGVSDEGRVIYSHKKMIECLMISDGMEYEDAEEFIDYNTIGALACMGEHAPIIMDEI